MPDSVLTDLPTRATSLPLIPPQLLQQARLRFPLLKILSTFSVKFSESRRWDWKTKGSALLQARFSIRTLRPNESQQKRPNCPKIYTNFAKELLHTQTYCNYFIICPQVQMQHSSLDATLTYRANLLPPQLFGVRRLKESKLMLDMIKAENRKKGQRKQIIKLYGNL